MSSCLNRFYKGISVVAVFYSAVLSVAPHSFTSAWAQGLESAEGKFAQLSELAMEEAETGKSAAAIRDFRAALTLNANWKEGRWNLGMLEYQTSEFPAAVADFKRVTGFAPQMGAAWAVLGLAEYELHHYEAALGDLEKGYALGIRDDEEIARIAEFHLALARTRAGEFEKARELLLRDFATGTPNAQVKIALGLTVLHAALTPAELDPSREALVAELGETALDHEHGAERLAAIAKSHPEIPSLKSGAKSDAATVRRLFALDTQAADSDQWTRIRQAFFTGQDAEAARELKTLLATHPDEGTAWAMLGLCEFHQKDTANALIHFDRSAKLGLKASEEEIRQARYTYAILLIHDGQFEQAAEVLFTAVDAKSSLAPQITEALGLALLHRQIFPEQLAASESELIEEAGRIAMLIGNSRYDEAFPQFDALLAAHPREPWLHYAYGTALIAISEFDRAEAQMKAESAITTKSELPLLRLASIALRRRDAQGAVDWARKALTLEAKSAEGHYLLGRGLLEAGDAGAAIVELERAAQLSPASPEVHFNLAKAYTRTHRMEDAERERKRFNELSAEGSKNPA